MAHKKGKMFQLEERKTQHKDILHVGGEVGVNRFEIVLVYMRTGNDADTKKYNEAIIEEIGKIKADSEDLYRGFILIGDLNGHLGYLLPRLSGREPKWKIDK